MAPRRTMVLVSVALLFAGMGTSIGNAQETPAPVKAVQLIGLAGIKQNAKGTLKVENGNLQFVHGKTNADISALSIQDVVTGDDTQRSVGGTVGVMSMAAPYGGGRFLSLFRKKIDTLTIQYRDAGGALHGAIFTMPVGAARSIKTELVSAGAHTATTGQPTTDAPSSKEQNALQFPEHLSGKTNASAIQVEMIQSDEVKLPAEFQIALYENLVHQIEKQRTFQHVYRDGDRTAASAPDLVVLHSTVRGFKAGSERARQVTTVAGATSIAVHCQFTGPDGKPLLARDVNGKVRFLGGNLKATYDFAKNAAHVVHENFAATDQRP
ncbi:MAG TPA: hypothetical protein VK525_12420 [Candidatus Saccharimonadales bacterium]|nr:hypothetical protein [Candidatus Saccharimonadales bacterium]